MNQVETEQTRHNDNPDYILGHTNHELQRLIEQGRFFGDLTAQVLQMAGLSQGMRVLDIGCGAGDVSFLAAAMVGPTGYVIGVDRSAEATALARQRAQQAGLANVEFITGELGELELDRTVDALIGRLVLMYVADPAALLRHLLRFVKPGGVVAFQELDTSAAKAEPYCELFATMAERINQTFIRAGIDPVIGPKLNRIFQEAGLVAPEMILGGRVASRADSPAFPYMEQLARTLLPLIVKMGMGTAEEIGIDTLAERLREEVIGKQATVFMPPLVGAWAQIAWTQIAWAQI